MLTVFFPDVPHDLGVLHWLTSTVLRGLLDNDTAQVVSVCVTLQKFLKN